jgi:heme oxygenase
LVLELLRERTAILHARAEKTLDLPAHCQSVSAYRRLLLRLLGFYVPIESRLGGFCWSEVGLDFDQRRKAGWLKEDLEALHEDPVVIVGIAQCQQLPALNSIARALGCLYVLEGATLGGQIISRRMKDTLGIMPATGGKFHAAYGQQTGEMWRRFRSAANDYCAHSIERREAAVAAAMETFNAFEQWLARGAR